MKKYNITKEFLEKEYVENKKSTLIIAKEVGCDRKTVYNYLKKYNIKIEFCHGMPKGEKHYNFGTNKYHINKKFLIEKYIKNKKSVLEIATEVGCGKGIIDFYLEKFNIKKRTISESLRGEKSSAYIDGRCSKTYFCIEQGCDNEISHYAWKYYNGRCRSCASKKLWQNKEYREKTIKALMEASQITPNKPERLLRAVLNKLFLNEYNFVGDGKVVFGGFCPDFINCNGQKKIIELYGDYWHNKSEVKERDKRRLIAYKKFGYKTLIIWEKELKDLEKVKDKVLNFNGGK